MTCGVKTIHHALERINLNEWGVIEQKEVYFVFDGKVNKVCIQNDMIRRSQLCIVLKVKSSRRLGSEKRKNGRSIVSDLQFMDVVCITFLLIFFRFPEL